MSDICFFPPVKACIFSDELGRLNMNCFCYLIDAMDQLEQRVSEFFMNAKKNKPEWREEQMASIKKVCSALRVTCRLKLGLSEKDILKIVFWISQ